MCFIIIFFLSGNKILIEDINENRIGHFLSPLMILSKLINIMPSQYQLLLWRTKSPWVVALHNGKTQYLKSVNQINIRGSWHVILTRTTFQLTLESLLCKWERKICFDKQGGMKRHDVWIFKNNIYNTMIPSTRQNDLILRNYRL